METLNSARLRCFGSYMPITNVILVDEDQQIWKGDRIIEVGSPIDVAETVYFSREYRPKTNELDRILTEKYFDDDSIIGTPFFLIPKEKILFGYDKPPTTIHLPPVKRSSSRPSF